MIFIDGLGLGVSKAEINPFVAASMPFLRSLLGGEALTEQAVGEGIISDNLVIRGVDATLGVNGIPQSATGQTALFAGVNGAKIAGRHLSGFPTPMLQTLIRSHSIFKEINQAGLKAVFANTFTREYFETVANGKWRHSVTTTAALSGGCQLFMVPDLIMGKAVYQDITNEQLCEKGYELPLFSPEQAASHLIGIAARNDFTLFEYFQTDRCGHSQEYELALTLLSRLDLFLATISKNLIERQLDLVIVSDHGNLEDLSVKTHTLNPIPLIALGRHAYIFGKCQSILDIYPAVLELLGVSVVEEFKTGAK